MKIFIASPSNLNHEKSIAKKVVDRINRKFSNRLNIFYTIYDFNDVLPGFGRPQEIINNQVNDCDLFIGLIWMKWGQATGEYSSGFEEEYNKVLERRELTGKPEIWLYFKKVSEDCLHDPGEELKKVLKFKERIIIEKKIYFHEFEDDLEWENKILDHLENYSIDLFKTQSEIIKNEIVSTIPENKGSMEENYKFKSKVYPSSLISAINKIEVNLNESKGIKSIEFLDIVRLFLFSFSAFSRVFNSEILGNHEINLIYLHKEKFELSTEETSLIFRTILSGDALKPGWYWFSNLEENKLFKAIYYYAIWDSNSDVRKGAFSFLTDLKYKVPKTLLINGLNDKEDIIRSQVIKLIKVLKRKNDLELIKPLLVNDEEKLKDEIVDTYTELLFSEDKNKAIKWIIKNEIKVPSYILNFNYFKEINLSNNLIGKALNSKETTIIILISRYLRFKKKITKNICEILINHNNDIVKIEGFLGLVNLGEAINLEDVSENIKGMFLDTNELIYKILENKNYDELLNLISWFDIDATLAYKVLAVNHWDIFENRLRIDIENEFENIKLKFIESFIPKSDANTLELKTRRELIEKIDKLFQKDLNVFIKNRYIESALTGLIKNGIKDDVKYGRHYLGKTNSNDIDIASIEIINKFGDSSDAQKLLEYALNSFGEQKILALKTAVNFSSALDDFLIKMLEQDDEQILKIALLKVNDLHNFKDITLIKKFLLNEKEDIRLLGLFILVKKCDFNGLVNILQEYINMGKYYYNVATWFDRIIFAPKYFKPILENKIKEINEGLNLNYKLIKNI